MLDTLLSCATCSVNFKDDANAASWSILFLLAVIVPVLGGVIWCMVRIARREEENLDPELRDH
ncbi:hypothetical protein [Haloferula sargassicola]|uniref:Cardiolipin synthase N-terminal domain-containing protein n=1 Tax=Haloferula sargassicola TaxID=490096 RepID=A0ABP9UN50_9BACT